MMERMTGHDIVCGYGRIGKAVVDELWRAGSKVVVVDSSGDRLRGLEARGVAIVTGDATLESTLREASVRQARGLVS
jgi:voltage-gated potassium channel